MASALAEDLVFMHSNFRLLSRHHEEYINVATKMWDITGDSWNASDTHGGVAILENATFTLDEPDFEAIVIGNDSWSVTISEIKFQSEAFDLENDDEGFI